LTKPTLIRPPRTSSTISDIFRHSNFHPITTQAHINQAVVTHQPFEPKPRFTFLQLSFLYKTKPNHTILVHEESQPKRL